MRMAHRSLRMLACLLIAGMELTRVAHGSHEVGSASRHDDNCTPSATSAESHEHSPFSPPAHDADQCQICHFIATGSAAIEAARPAIVVNTPQPDLRISPVVAEPHSADVDLPCAARAPPIVPHAA